MLAGALLLLQAGTHAQFTVVQANLPNMVESTVAWGDYNDDGRLDLFIAGTMDTLGGAAFDLTKNVTRVYRNNGNSTFTDINAGLDPVYVASAAWGDYDNDGYLDLLYAGVDTTNTLVTRLYHNNHNGTFTFVPTTFHSAAYGGLSWCDFNNDGLLDVFLTGYDLHGPTTRLYRNMGAGNFTEVTGTGLVGVNGHSKIAWGDYDNDGYLDPLYCGRTNGVSETDPRPVTKLYHNEHGTGAFVEDTAAHLLGVWRGAVAFGDFNKDGWKDIVVAGRLTGNLLAADDTTQVYGNNGDGTFTPVQVSLASTFSASATVGDYNADGLLDVFLTGYGAGFPPYKNLGDMLFNHTWGDDGVAFGHVQAGDINGDGYLDFVMTGVNTRNGHDTTAVYRNSMLGSSTSYRVNSAPSAPSNLHTTVISDSVVLGWAAATDSTTPQVSLTYNIRVGTTPGGSDRVGPMALSNGFRKVVQLGNAEFETMKILRHLAPGTYYWSVQAIDNSYAGSPFAAESSFTVSGAPVVHGLRVNTRVILQGPYVSAGDSMSTALRTSGTLASHFGSVSIPPQVVDSVSIEIRDSATVASSHTRRLLPAWLLKDGSLRSFTDSTRNYVQFDSLTAGSFYIVVRHRNHLAIMSASRVALNDTATTTYDFTTGQAKAWGTNSMVAVGTKFAMAAGDGDGSGGVNASDLNGAWRPQNGQLGYLRGDYDLSGGVNATDRNGFWKVNNGKVSQVP